MGKSILLTPLLLLSLAACSSSDAFSGSRWHYSGGFSAPMTITLERNGDVRFQGGYTFYEDASWHYNGEQKVLSITLPSAQATDLQLQGDEHVRPGEEYPIEVDIEGKTVNWRLSRNDDAFVFQLYRFERMP